MNTDYSTKINDLCNRIINDENFSDSVKKKMFWIFSSMGIVKLHKPFCFQVWSNNDSIDKNLWSKMFIVNNNIDLQSGDLISQKVFPENKEFNIKLPFIINYKDSETYAYEFYKCESVNEEKRLVKYICNDSRHCKIKYSSAKVLELYDANTLIKLDQMCFLPVIYNYIMPILQNKDNGKKPLVIESGLEYSGIISYDINNMYVKVFADRSRNHKSVLVSGCNDYTLAKLTKSSFAREL